MVVGSFASGSDVARQIAGLNVGKYDVSGQRLPLTPDSEDGMATSSTSAAGYTRVYQSSSGIANKHSAVDDEYPQPWKKFIHDVPLISHISSTTDTKSKGIINFKPPPWSSDSIHPPIDDVDVIIFATGYNFAYPFFKADDPPWNEKRMLDGIIQLGEREGGEESDSGGLKGLGMKDLDELLLFLKDDRSIAFPALREFFRLQNLCNPFNELTGD